MKMSTHLDIPKNSSASETVIVTHELTVAHLIPGMPEVYGTPCMIYLMEHAAATAIRPFLPPGWISVGTQVNVRHLAATPLGFQITATATVQSVSDRLVVFSVKAHDGIDLVGEGTHERAVMDLSRLQSKISAKKAMR